MILKWITTYKVKEHQNIKEFKQNNAQDYW